VSGAASVRSVTEHSSFGSVVTLLCAPPWHLKILLCLLAQWDRCLIDGSSANLKVSKIEQVGNAEIGSEMPTEVNSLCANPRL
jgi:hypothetical protein